MPGPRRTGARRKRTAAARKKSSPRRGARTKVARSGAAARARTRRARAGRTGSPRRRARPAAPALVPSSIGVVAHHMDYSSHDVEQVRRFYTETLGFTNFNFDSRHSYLWVQTGPGSSLGFMPPMPGPPEQWRPPREPSIYLIVEDVDRAHRDLTAKGVVFEQAPADMTWGHRTAVLRDPEGRLLCLAQPIDR